MIIFLIIGNPKIKVMLFTPIVLVIKPLTCMQDRLLGPCFKTGPKGSYIVTDQIHYRHLSLNKYIIWMYIMITKIHQISDTNTLVLFIFITLPLRSYY